MDKKIILNRIEELMKEKGKTKYQLKENADISTTIYQWKKNAQRDKMRVPSLRSIEKICDFLGVSLPYFFTFNKEEQKDARITDLTESISKLNNEQICLLESLVKQLSKSNE